MMASLPLLSGGNLTGDDGVGVEEAPTVQAILKESHNYLYTSMLPQESSLLGVPSTSPVAEGAWVVGVGVEVAWEDVLVLVLKGLVMAAVIVASVLGNLLVIVSVARSVPPSYRLFLSLFDQ